MGVRTFNLRAKGINVYYIRIYKRYLYVSVACVFGFNPTNNDTGHKPEFYVSCRDAADIVFDIGGGDVGICCSAWCVVLLLRKGEVVVAGIVVVALLFMIFLLTLVFLRL